VIRASTASRFSGVVFLRFTPSSRMPRDRSLPRSAASWSRSISTTSMPASAATWAMPAPIIPAPSTPSLRTLWSGALGRTAPFSSACLLRKSERIIAVDDGFRSTLVNQRASIRSAVSNGTSAPS
jgi:hypothetical protein